MNKKTRRALHRFRLWLVYLDNALENLNIVHNRAGLPAITETDQAKLRAIIQREDAIEFFQENHRYFDVKHWKLPNVGNGICGGPMRMLQFNIKNDEAATWPFAAKWIETWWDSVVYTMDPSSKKDATILTRS